MENAQLISLSRQMGLQRQMEVGAHRRRGGHGGDHVVAEVLGMGAGEAHPLDALHRPDEPEEVAEQWSGPAAVLRGPHRAGDERPPSE